MKTIEPYNDSLSEKREELDRAMGEGDARAAELIRLADALKEVFDREETAGGYLAQSSSDLGPSRFHYILRMEEALMRIQANTRESIARGIEIYKELETLFPDRPTVRYRLGWALGKEGKPLEAIDRYFTALRLVDEALLLEPKERESRVSEREIEHLRERLPRFIGYQYWRIAQARAHAGDANAQIAYLVEAYRTTLPGLASTSDKVQQESLHNNLLYYAVQYLTVCDKNVGKIDAATLGLITLDDMRKHLDYLEENVNIASSKSVDHLDTLCRAYVFLERYPEAVRAAERVLALLFEEPGHPVRLDDAQTEMAAYGHQIVKQHRRV